MMSFKAENGATLADEMLEKMAEPWDKGELPGIGGEVLRGRPRLSSETLEVVSFKVPHSLALNISQAANKRGTTRSEFLRDAAIEKISRTLT